MVSLVSLGVEQFGGKLYLEFGGKLFDDYHASRVLPGFEPDSKIRMLKALSEDAEIVIAINADAIEKNKRRGDLGKERKESEVTQSCPTLCNPLDCSLPGSSVHGIFQIGRASCRERV